MGPVAARFNAKVALSDVDPPQGCTISFDGQGGAAGHGRGTAKVKLAPQDDGRCELSYDVNAQVGGKIAQVGQRLIDSVSKAMAEDFFKRFDGEMQKRFPPAVPPVAPVEVRPAVPVWVWVAGAIVLIVIAWLLLRS
jgi:carbon monoxide dehydrogenase subunit G